MKTSLTSGESQRTFVVVDFGGTKISAARIAHGEIVDRKQVSTDQSAAPESHLATICELIDALSTEPDASVGVAVCGRVDSEGHWHALNDNTLRGFLSFPLREKLTEQLGRSVCVMNDATAAAWGEYCFGPDGDDVESLLYITVSTGVGGGIVLGGRPLTSADGLATHFGFMTSRFGSAECGSGRTGTLESIASGTAIGRLGSENHDKPLNGFEVYQAYLAGEETATTVVERSARAIAKAIADVRALLGIQVVAIGGSVGLDQGYLPLVQRFLDEEPELFRPQLRPACLGKDSALFGVAAASMALNGDAIDGN